MAQLKCIHQMLTTAFNIHTPILNDIRLVGPFGCSLSIRPTHSYTYLFSISSSTILSPPSIYVTYLSHIPYIDLLYLLYTYIHPACYLSTIAPNLARPHSRCSLIKDGAFPRPHLSHPTKWFIITVSVSVGLYI